MEKITVYILDLIALEHYVRDDEMRDGSVASMGVGKIHTQLYSDILKGEDHLI